jgi:hypothetical protein
MAATLRAQRRLRSERAATSRQGQHAVHSDLLGRSQQREAAKLNGLRAPACHPLRANDATTCSTRSREPAGTKGRERKALTRECRRTRALCGRRAFARNNASRQEGEPKPARPPCIDLSYGLRSAEAKQLNTLRAPTVFVHRGITSNLTLEMSGSWRRAKPAGNCPLDRRVGRHLCSAAKNSSGDTSACRKMPASVPTLTSLCMGTTQPFASRFMTTWLPL